MGRPPWVSRSSHLLPPGWFGAWQHGATGALGPFCPLGTRVPRPAPLAVGAVHSLPQVRSSLTQVPCEAWLSFAARGGQGAGQALLGPKGAGLRAGPPRTRGGGAPGRPSLTRGRRLAPTLPHPPDDPLACRKAARRQQARLQGQGMTDEAVSARLSRGQGGADRGPISLPCPQSLLRRPHLCSLSKSDTRLHELHQGRGGCIGEPGQEAGAVGGFAAPHPPNPSDLCPDPTPAPRPASVDLLCLQYLDTSRGTARPLAALSHRALPQPSISPEATYSNVGLAAIPRASLAASPMVWAGTWLTSSCARPGPEARPMVPEYARIHKLKGPQGVERQQAEGTPATQVKGAGRGVGWVGLGRSSVEWMVLTPLWAGFLSPDGHPVFQGQQAQKEGPRTCHQPAGPQGSGSDSDSGE